MLKYGGGMVLVTFIASGEEGYRDGIIYTLGLLERRGVLEKGEANLFEASMKAVTLGDVPEDRIYVIGDHMTTYGILKRINVGAVVSVDAHTDLLHDYFDHGSWLAYALEEKVVRKAAVMGPVLMIPTTPRTSLWTRNVRIYPALPRTRRTPSGWRAYISIRKDLRRAIEDARRYLGDRIHLTVDMDVLRPEYRIARFQHGELCLDELIELLDAIGKAFEVRSCDMAEVSSRVRKSRLGRNAVVEVFKKLRGLCR